MSCHFHQHINVHALVVAAGKGSRFGSSVPKQHLIIQQHHNQKTILQCSVEQLAKSTYINECVLVIAKDDVLSQTLAFALPMQFAIGGEQRWQSVVSGLLKIKELGAAKEDLVVIHDAARPAVACEDVDSVIKVAMQEPYGAILATPATDTLKQSLDGMIEKTINREQIWLAQTPQVFRFGHLMSVMQWVIEEGVDITDEASAFEAKNLPIRLVKGNRNNIKLTYPEDLQLLSYILNQGH